MSGLELTGRLPCPGSSRPPCLLCPALFFPRCRERWEKGEVRPEEHPSRGSGGGGARGGGGGEIYEAAGPPAAVATATAAAILGPYCTGSRYGHVTAPARPSLLYAAGRASERARAPATCAGLRRERASSARRLATPPPFRSPPLLASLRKGKDRRCAASGVLRLRLQQKPAEAELDPSRKVY